MKMGIARLPQIELSSRHQLMLDRAVDRCQASPALRARMRAEGHDLLALSQIAPRLEVIELDMAPVFRSLFRLQTTVPTMPQPDGPLQIEQQALLGLTYRLESFRQPTPGYGFIQVLAPAPCWLANISNDGVQALCLGLSLPAGVRVKDLVLMAYGALTMQTVMNDELDRAGVLSVPAARWWQQNMHLAPLSAEPFIHA